ncbi:MAG: ABC transporter permease [Desertimonas sp.]
MTTSLALDSRLLAGRSITQLRRNPASIVSTIVFPLLFFALFNIVMRKIMSGRGFDYVQLLPTTVVVQAMFFSAMSSAYYVADDRLKGITGRLRSMPIHAAAPLTGRAAADTARGTVSLIVVLAVGIAAGMRFGAGWAWLPAYVCVGMLFTLAVATAIGLLGYIASSPSAASSLASVPYLPLLMVSTGFAPVDDFPGWLQAFVDHQPVSANIDALRALAGDGSIGNTVPVALAWSIGLAVVFVSLGARLMRTRT